MTADILRLSNQIHNQIESLENKARLEKGKNDVTIQNVTDHNAFSSFQNQNSLSKGGIIKPSRMKRSLKILLR